MESLKQHISRREHSFNDERKAFFRDVMMLKELARIAGLSSKSQVMGVSKALEEQIEERMRNNSGAQAAQTAYFSAESRRNEELASRIKELEAEREESAKCVQGSLWVRHALCVLCFTVAGGVARAGSPTG